MRHWRRLCSIGCPMPRSLTSDSAARSSVSRTPGALVTTSTVIRSDRRGRFVRSHAVPGEIHERGGPKAALAGIRLVFETGPVLAPAFTVVALIEGVLPT